MTTKKKQDDSQKKGYDNGLTIRVAKTTLVEWQKVFQKYRIEIFSYNFKKMAEKQFFVAILSHWKLSLGDDLKGADSNFWESVTSPGNRKSDRTVSREDTDSTFFGLKRWETEDYFNVMFSYVQQNSNKTDFDASMYSTSYFFYDMVDYAKANIKGIIALTKENE